MLRYAVSDARAAAKVFAGMGGIAAGDTVLLVEPNIREINRQLDVVAAQVSASKQTYKRTEVVFYYSGHSDEKGLLLNREQYGYRELREKINLIPSDMRIVILDSCSSGAFTRAKGGIKTQPFLIDGSLSAQGYAFLTSSSANEASQESDNIEGSYFTHSLLAGLRGAADTVGDGRVTLNEAYRYAYTETMARTETSLYGAQHPSYDMQVSGTGDVVLTDLSETSASLAIGTGISGRLSIRDGSGYLVAEISKLAGKPMELGLEPGMYGIVLQQGDSFYRAEVLLTKDRHMSIRPADFTPVAARAARARGDDAETGDAAAAAQPDAQGAALNAAAEEPEEDVPYVFASLQLVPGVGIPFGFEKSANALLWGAIGAQGYNLNGIGLAGIWLTNTGSVTGLQMSGVFNTVGKRLNGVQTAGIFNTAGGDSSGVQAAGIFNTAQGNFRGVQAAGLFNTAQGNFSGVQSAGLFNVTQGDFSGVQAAGLFNTVQGNISGVQTAGLFNVAKDGMSGIQTGLINWSGENSSFLFQAGLINISKSERTIPVGLVNIVKNGILNPAVYYDDTRFINASFRSGSKYFYSILSAGVQLSDVGKDMWADGALFVSRGGIGAEIPIGRFFVDLDVTGGNYIDFGASDFGSYTQCYQLRLTAGFKAFKHLGVFAGLSYDYITGSGGIIDSLGSAGLYNTGDGTTMQKIGFFGGVQF